MKLLVVVLVLLQTCSGSPPIRELKPIGILPLPNEGDWNTKMETKGEFQGDITPSKDESASEEEEEEEFADEAVALPDDEEETESAEEEEYSDDMASPSTEEEEDSDDMVASPSKEEEEDSDEEEELRGNEKKGELLDVEEEAPTDDTIEITKRSSKRGSQWPNAVIPYVIDGNVGRKSRQAIRSAIADFKKYTCIRFVPRSSQTKYARFSNKGKNSGCNSPIGVPEGSRNVNDINLEEPGCQKHGTVLHEMCHTIGLHHEQTRVDRNKYVRFIKANVKNGMFEVNFQTKANDPKFWQSFNTPYDYYSIMHYGAFAFSQNGQRTIITTDKNVQYLIGTMNHMSPTDAKQINLMYNCPQWRSYQKPPAFKCVDEKKRCDLYIAQNTCPKVYDICCKSCRDGLKCEDYDKACPRIAKQGACTPGRTNYKFAKQNCCKTCKGGSGSGNSGRGSGNNGRRPAPTNNGRRPAPTNNGRRPAPTNNYRRRVTNGRRPAPTNNYRRRVTNYRRRVTNRRGTTVITTSYRRIPRGRSRVVRVTYGK